MAAVSPQEETDPKRFLGNSLQQSTSTTTDSLLTDKENRPSLRGIPSIPRKKQTASRNDGLLISRIQNSVPVQSTYKTAGSKTTKSKASFQRTTAISWREVLQMIERDQTFDPNLIAVLRRLHEDNHKLVVALDHYNMTKDFAALKVDLEFFFQK